jgi:hypothetical protein
MEIDMHLFVSILDETSAGESRSAGSFHFYDQAVTLREIIRLRVQQEVERFNRSESEVFQGLVQPEESERMLNGVRTRPVIDWEKQYLKAVKAFKSNGFLVFVDDRQITELDETIRLTPESQLTFLKLVPLIGG